MNLLDNSFVEYFLEKFPSHKRLKEEVSTDPLTQLGSRRAFEKMHARERARVLRGMGKPLSLITVDIDNFKSVNDGYGHAVGDMLLAKFGKLVKSTERATDFAARMGGEEFAILLPNTHPRGALVHALDLLLMFRRNLFVVIWEGDKKTKVSRTASIGVVTWDEKETPEEFLVRGDIALYSAKKSGRDKVVQQ
jgi:diguanylate cyclase (GGDEF)-like protein